jgi:hypothetical protein
MTNFCIYDCAYCINRASSGVERARFSVDEVVRLTIEFYRRNYIEGLFLSQASMDGTVTISDTGTGKYVCSGSESDGVVQLVDTTGLDASAGVLVPGPMYSSLFVSSSRFFTPAATPLCPSCIQAPPVPGVRALVLDGVKATGHAVISDSPGAYAFSYMQSGTRILEIGFTGYDDLASDDCGECGLIRRICVHKSAGSGIEVYQVNGHTLAIGLAGITRDDICGRARSVSLPDIDGNLPGSGAGACDESVPPIPYEGEEKEFCFDMPDVNGRFIIAPVDEEGGSAIIVRTVNGRVTIGRVK